MNILFFKAYVKPHTRKLTNGKTVQVGGYNTKAAPRNKDSENKQAADRIPPFDVHNATPESADKWIAALHDKGLLFHFDDDPAEVINAKGRTFTDAEVKTLQPIVDAIFDIDGYDPFETAVKLSN